MKKFLAIVCVLSFAIAQAQDKEPKFEAVGDLVKATYYFEDGSVHKQGFFKDKKLTGEWTQFNEKGAKISIGYYKEGKKVGTWIQWKNNTVRQITFENYSIASISDWKENLKVATRNK